MEEAAAAGIDGLELVMGLLGGLGRSAHGEAANHGLAHAEGKGRCAEHQYTGDGQRYQQLDNREAAEICARSSGS